MQGDVGTPKVTYHAETGLLMCTANESGLRAADQVISQLPGGDDVLERSRESRASKEKDNPWNRVVSRFRRGDRDWNRRDEPQTEEERERHEEMRKRMEDRIKRFRKEMMKRRKKDQGEEGNPDIEAAERGERDGDKRRGKPPWAGRDKEDEEREGDKERDRKEEREKDGDHE